MRYKTFYNKEAANNKSHLFSSGLSQHEANITVHGNYKNSNNTTMKLNRKANTPKRKSKNF